MQNNLWCPTDPLRIRDRWWLWWWTSFTNWTAVPGLIGKVNCVYCHTVMQCPPGVYGWPIRRQTYITNTSQVLLTSLCFLLLLFRAHALIWVHSDAEILLDEREGMQAVLWPNRQTLKPSYQHTGSLCPANTVNTMYTTEQASELGLTPIDWRNLIGRGNWMPVSTKSQEKRSLVCCSAH